MSKSGFRNCNTLEVACYGAAHLVRTITRCVNMNLWKSRFFVLQFKAFCKFVTGIDFMTYESSDLVFSISGIKKYRFFWVALFRSNEIIYVYMYIRVLQAPTKKIIMNGFQHLFFCCRGLVHRTFLWSFVMIGKHVGGAPSQFLR